MRVFHILPGSVHETDTLPHHPPPEGFVWIACGRREFELEQTHIQSSMQLLHGHPLVDLRISDLLNNQLPSHFDCTSQYDILVFQRLAAGHSETDLSHPGQPLRKAKATPRGHSRPDRGAGGLGGGGRQQRSLRRSQIAGAAEGAQPRRAATHAP